MDPLTKKLHSLLVEMGIAPANVPHTTEHYIEHLIGLLENEEEQAIVDYYGLFGTPRRSLHEVAQTCHKTDEDMMALIDKSLRRLAMTPEWEYIVTNEKTK